MKNILHSIISFFKQKKNEVQIDGYLVNIEPEIIEGYRTLVLEVGKKYNIRYGIHRGEYEYVGKVSENDKNNPYSHGEHLFRYCKTGEITFGYYGYTSPWEFTSIVQPLN